MSWLFLDLVFSAIVLVVLNAVKLCVFEYVGYFSNFGTEVCKCGPLVVVVLFGCVGFQVGLVFWS